MATQGDYYAAGAEIGTSGALVAEWTLTPSLPVAGNAEGAGTVSPKRVVVISYEIFQLGSGTGTALLFYDATAAPANGTAWFGNTSPTPNVQWVIPIVAGQAHIRDDCFHRFEHGLTVVLCSAAGVGGQTIARASASMLATVHYLPFDV